MPLPQIISLQTVAGGALVPPPAESAKDWGRGTHLTNHDSRSKLGTPVLHHMSHAHGALHVLEYLHVCECQM